MLLLVIIYLAFISLGLPDGVLGAAWPIISQDLNTSLEYAGAISFIAAGGTVISSLLTARVVHRFGTGKVLAFSVLATAIGLVGFAQANFVLTMVALAVPLGLGGGAVDAALNNYVALNYRSKHMNYLHSCWGLGATTGPFIMSIFIATTDGWRYGYWTLAGLQFALVVALFVTLPLWKNGVKAKEESDEAKETAQDEPVVISNKAAAAIDGVKSQLLLFFCYCSLEAGTGLWAASYLTEVKSVNPASAAFWTAVFFLSITGGRFFCGMIADRFSEESLVRVGVFTILLGVVAFMLPLPVAVTQASLVLIGIGCAPIYPNTMHMTPQRFGKGASQAIIGLSMATAYTGITFVPPLIGVGVGAFSFGVFPLVLLVLSVTMLLASEKLRRRSLQSDLEVQHG